MQRYTGRINRVIDYIQKNIEEDLSLDILSAEGYFSKFHFHRIFKAFTGETLNQYVRRQRLEKSLNLLLKNPQKPITDIALESGFSTPSNYTRLFQKYYRLSPSRFRKYAEKEGKGALRRLNKNLIKQNSFLKVKEVPFYPENVEIKKLPGFHVAYHRLHQGYYFLKLYQTFNNFKKYAKKDNIVSPDTVMIGIINDDPDITPFHKCRYDACIVIPNDIKSYRGYNILDIPPGLYAVYPFSGNLRDIPSVWQSLFSQWLFQSDYEPDDKQGLEIFSLHQDKSKKNQISMKICLPIKK